MAEEQQTQNIISSLTSEFGTRLNELEEKQRLLKDRLLLVGENLIQTKEAHEKEMLEFKNQLKEIGLELKSISQINKRIIENLADFARKTDLEILARQAKMFQPLEFARINDVERMLNEKLKK